MSTGAGVNVSKAVVYAVLGKPKGVNISKAQAYAVLGSSVGVNVSKAQAYAVLVPIGSNPPIWDIPGFPLGFLGIPYTALWDMTNSALVVTYSLTAGALPPGLTLSAMTGNQARISGVPTSTGTFAFTLTAVNSYGSSSQSFSIEIDVPSTGGNFGWSC